MADIDIAIDDSYDDGDSDVERRSRVQKNFLAVTKKAVIQYRIFLRLIFTEKSSGLQNYSFTASMKIRSEKELKLRNTKMFQQSFLLNFHARIREREVDLVKSFWRFVPSTQLEYLLQ